MRSEALDALTSIYSEATEMADDTTPPRCRRSLPTDVNARLPQRQDSLNDQFSDVVVMANKMGCYDATALILRLWIALGKRALDG